MKTLLPTAALPPVGGEADGGLQGIWPRLARDAGSSRLWPFIVSSIARRFPVRWSRSSGWLYIVKDLYGVWARFLLFW